MRERDDARGAAGHAQPRSRVFVIEIARSHSAAGGRRSRLRAAPIRRRRRAPRRAPGRRPGASRDGHAEDFGASRSSLVGAAAPRAGDRAARRPSRDARHRGDGIRVRARSCRCDDRAGTRRRAGRCSCAGTARSTSRGDALERRRAVTTMRRRARPRRRRAHRRLLQRIAAAVDDRRSRRAGARACRPAAPVSMPGSVIVRRGAAVAAARPSVRLPKRGGAARSPRSAASAVRAVARRAPSTRRPPRTPGRRSASAAGARRASAASSMNCGRCRRLVARTAADAARRSRRDAGSRSAAGPAECSRRLNKRTPSIASITSPAGTFRSSSACGWPQTPIGNDGA